jgi:predicted RNA polymerase sigma factor
MRFMRGGDGGLGDHYRLHAVRAHLLELAGDREGAVSEFKYAAARTTNLRERNYLTTKAAQVAADRSRSPGGKAGTRAHGGAS